MFIFPMNFQDTNGKEKCCFLIILKRNEAIKSMTKNASYLPRGQRILNTIFTRMVLMGLIPGAHLIRVPGRKSGVMHTTPIFVLKYEGQRWLVSGFGQSDWAKNLSVAGWCILIHDRREERITVVEINDPKIRAPILHAFARRSPVGHRGFSIKRNASLEEFAAIAPHHPVFHIEEDNKKASEPITIKNNIGSQQLEQNQGTIGSLPGLLCHGRRRGGIVHFFTARPKCHVPILQGRYTALARFPSLCLPAFGERPSLFEAGREDESDDHQSQ